jgi:hypothetical protein
VQADDNNTEVPTSVESSAPAPESSSVSSSAETSAPQSSGEKSAETLLDAVLKVTDVTDEPTVESENAAKEEPQSSEAESEVKAEDEKQEGEPEPDEEPSADLPATTRKKINKLLKERRELREEVEQLRAYVPAAEIGQQFHNFQQSHNLSTESIIDALDLLVKVHTGDYQGFYERIAPLIRHTQEVLGVVLPTDLQQMVEHQQMTPQAAQQFAQTRFEKANYEIQTNAMKTRQEHAYVAQVKDNVQRSVTAFEQRLAASDPDYKAKADSVRRTAQAMLLERGGKINSVDDALAITKAAYDEVNAQFRRLAPAPRATASAPGRTNPQTPQARPQPKNMMDAVRNALAR